MVPQRKIAIITSHYPIGPNDFRRAFVRNMALELERQGHDAHIISPLALHAALWTVFTSDQAKDGDLDITRPVFFSAGNYRTTLGNTFALTQRSFSRAVTRCPVVNPDYVYGHFLYPAGAAAADVGRARSLPSFCGAGESDISRYERRVGIKRMAADAKRLDGLIAMSEKTASYLQHDLGIEDEKVLLLPNGADTQQFFPTDKAAARRKLRLPHDIFIVTFVGAFSERKGPLRVLRALERVDDAFGIFLGTGPQQPRGEKVLFSAPVDNDDVRTFLSASDVFMLPTLAEGSSNAIAEAMACGLPIITSDLPFNSYLPDEACIKIDPLDDEAIASAIRHLKGNEALRRRLGVAGLRYTRSFNLKTRISTMVDWFERRAGHRSAAKRHAVAGT